jgi:hypothetical protein
LKPLSDSEEKVILGHFRKLSKSELKAEIENLELSKWFSLARNPNQDVSELDYYIHLRCKVLIRCLVSEMRKA